MIYAVTGHRPTRLGEDWQRALPPFCMKVLARTRPTGLCVGMAEGLDMEMAIAAIRLGIPFIAALPFADFEDRRSAQAQAEYRMVLAQASFVTTVSQEKTSAALQYRNEWLVDNSANLLALWDGEPHGGTYNCIQYARGGRRSITQLWPEWAEYNDSGAWLV